MIYLDACIEICFVLLIMTLTPCHQGLARSWESWDFQSAKIAVFFKLKSRDFSRFFVTVFWTPWNALSPTNLFHFFITVNPVPKIRLARHCDTTDYSAGIWSKNSLEWELSWLCSASDLDYSQNRFGFETTSTTVSSVVGFTKTLNLKKKNRPYP